VPSFHPQIGKQIKDLVSFLFNVIEYDGTIGMKRLFYCIQFGFKSPTVGNFMRMCPIEELIGQVDED